MDVHPESDAGVPPEREELGISTGLIEWFESAPWVIEGRLVPRPAQVPGLSVPRTKLSRFQVEFPSRRWFMENGLGEDEAED